MFINITLIKTIISYLITKKILASSITYLFSILFGSYTIYLVFTNIGGSTPAAFIDNIIPQTKEPVVIFREILNNYSQTITIPLNNQINITASIDYVKATMTLNPLAFKIMIHLFPLFTEVEKIAALHYLTTYFTCFMNLTTEQLSNHEILRTYYEVNQEIIMTELTKIRNTIQPQNITDIQTNLNTVISTTRTSSTLIISVCALVIVLITVAKITTSI